MKREPIILDAKNRSLGRVASEAAQILRGKTDPAYERHVMPSDKVIITNAARVRITGNKLKQEALERYSGYPGGLKKITYERTFQKDPRELVRHAVAGMIPRNRLKKDILKNLTIYAADKE